MNANLLQLTNHIKRIDLNEYINISNTLLTAQDNNNEEFNDLQYKLVVQVKNLSQQFDNLLQLLQTNHQPQIQSARVPSQSNSRANNTITDTTSITIIEQLKKLYAEEQQKVKKLIDTMTIDRIQSQTRMNEMEQQVNISNQRYKDEEIRTAKQREQLEILNSEFQALKDESQRTQQQLTEKLQISQQLISNLNSQLKTQTELNQQHQQNQQRTFQEQNANLLEKLSAQRKELNILQEREAIDKREIERLQSELTTMKRVQDAVRTKYQDSAAYYKQLFEETSQQNYELQAQLAVQQMQDKKTLNAQVEMQNMQKRTKEAVEAKAEADEIIQKNKILIKDLIDQRTDLENQLINAGLHKNQQTTQPKLQEHDIDYFKQRIQQQNDDITKLKGENKTFKRQIQQLSDIILERDEIIHELQLHVQIMHETRKGSNDLQVTIPINKPIIPGTNSQKIKLTTDINNIEIQ